MNLNPENMEIKKLFVDIQNDWKVRRNTVRKEKHIDQF